MNALKDSVSELLEACAESADCIEVDPLKIYEQLKINNGAKDRKAMLENQQVKTVVDKSESRSLLPLLCHSRNIKIKIIFFFFLDLPKLEYFCELFVNRIFETANLVPHGIRWICKQLYLYV